MVKVGIQAGVRTMCERCWRAGGAEIGREGRGGERRAEVKRGEEGEGRAGGENRR